jgi:hypothetical protein
MPEELVSVSIPATGGRVHISTDTGKVLALGTDGAELWSLTLQPDAHLANAPGGGLLAADGSGTLHHISDHGKRLRKHNIWEDSLPRTRQRRNELGLRRDAKPSHYLEPNTLELAKKHLGAKIIAQWKNTGETKERAGRIFHHTDEIITLKSGEAEHSFLHLVYCNEREDAPLLIETSGKTRQEFQLDLPTPSYRIINIPLQGANQQVSIHLNRSIGIAQCTLWSYEPPGPNIAFQPSLTSLLDASNKTDPKNNSLVDDLLGAPSKPEEEDDLLNPVASNSSVQKKLRVWWPNTDPVRTQGRFLTPKVEARIMVDRQRFGSGKDVTPPWSNYYAPWGASFTIEYATPQKLSLVATYDRTTLQSKVSKAIQVFSGTMRNEHDNPQALGTILENDQFWRLFPITINRKTKTLGIHAFSGRGPDGLSEVEAYP